MQHEMSRRDLLKSVLVAGALIPAFGLIANDSRAAELTPLDPNEPGPKAFGFVADAATVDVTAYPTFKVGQHCSVCAQFKGNTTDARGGCSIFEGRSVPAGGWCQVWAQRPG